MKFETARVCVLRRVPVPQSMELFPVDSDAQQVLPVTIDLPPEFTYEVIAWPPGEVDGGLLPHNGDQITLPGHELPFRVCDRTLHWPPPTSPEARRGEVRVDLIVEPMPDSPTRSPFGRPGEQELQQDGRWLPGEVRYFKTGRTRDNHGMVTVQFAVDGVGTLAWSMVRNFSAVQMFPDLNGLNSGTDEGFVDPAEVLARLALGQRFELRVAPGYAGRTEIREVRPLPEPEPQDQPNTWDEQAQEVTASNEVRGGQN